MQYKGKIFDLPEIKGLSQKQIDVHLKLYAGYVNQVNKVYEELEVIKSESNLAETDIRRRLGFEISGMKHHEVYFSLLEGGAKPISDGALKSAVEKTYGSFDSFLEEIKKIATSTRGIGWIIVCYDSELEKLHTLWVADHELGNVAMPTVLAVDMWEHAYMVDYAPIDKGEYVSAYLSAINWEAAEKRFSKVV